MEPDGFGIEHSKDVDNVYHLRLMALLKELVRDRGYKGAARILEIDHRTVADCVKAGKLSRRARSALERALQEGAGSAAALQRERNERLEERMASVEGEVDKLGKETRRRLTAMERNVAALQAGDVQAPRRTDVSNPQKTTSSSGAPQSRSLTWPTLRPPTTREYPELATLEPAPDDKEVFGKAWPLIMLWRELKEVHPTQGSGLAWLTEEERLLEVELALLEDHGLTLPPERQPLRGFDRSGQISWRSTALSDTRRARRRRERLLTLRQKLTLGLWRKPQDPGVG